MRLKSIINRTGTPVSGERRNVHGNRQEVYKVVASVHNIVRGVEPVYERKVKCIVALPLVVVPPEVGVATCHVTGDVNRTDSAIPVVVHEENGADGRNHLIGEVVDT